MTPSAHRSTVKPFARLIAVAAMVLTMFAVTVVPAFDSAVESGASVILPDAIAEFVSTPDAEAWGCGWCGKALAVGGAVVLGAAVVSAVVACPPCGVASYAAAGVFAGAAVGTTAGAVYGGSGRSAARGAVCGAATGGFAWAPPVYGMGWGAFGATSGLCY